MEHGSSNLRERTNYERKMAGDTKEPGKSWHARRFWTFSISLQSQPVSARSPAGHVASTIFSKGRGAAQGSSGARREPSGASTSFIGSIASSISASLGAQQPMFDHTCVQHCAVAQWRTPRAQRRIHEFDWAMPRVMGVNIWVAFHHNSQIRPNNNRQNEIKP